MPARGGGPGGKRGGSRGGRGSKPQRGCRSVPTEEEVMARNRMGDPADNSEHSEEEEQEEEQQQQQAEPQQQSRPPKSFLESDDDEMLIGAGNPNRNPNLSEALGPSRREREALEHAKHQALMQKLEAEGKTSKAKADLARLAEIRKQRERAKATTSPQTR